VLRSINVVAELSDVGEIITKPISCKSLKTKCETYF